MEAFFNLLNKDLITDTPAFSGAPSNTHAAISEILRGSHALETEIRNASSLQQIGQDENSIATSTPYATAVNTMTTYEKMACS